MKNSTYRDAVNNLRFSGDLLTEVRKSESPERKRIPLFRIAVITAVVSTLLMTTAFAAGNWIERDARLISIGSVKEDLSDAEIMEFRVIDTNDGVVMHYMELGPKGFYTFRDGMLYSSKEGFFRITDDYTLEKLESSTLCVNFSKNGRVYSFEIEYILANDGVYSDGLLFYPLTDGEILIRAVAEDGYLWPVYVDLETGDSRDALPDFTEDSFSGIVSYAQPFRDGILVTSGTEHVVNGNSRYETFYYWIDEGNSEAEVLDWPSGWEYIVGDTLYYKTRTGSYYRLDENFVLQPLQDVPETTDDITEGLLTVQNPDGTLGIIDLINGISHRIPALEIGGGKMQETEGWNATRNSSEGRILLTNAVMDWVAEGRKMDVLALLDTDNGVLKLLDVDSGYTIHTSGWFDDDRYCVIYKDVVIRYLCIYEFTD